MGIRLIDTVYSTTIDIVVMFNVVERVIAEFQGSTKICFELPFLDHILNLNLAYP